MAAWLGRKVERALVALGDRYEHNCVACGDAGYVLTQRLRVEGGQVVQPQQVERCRSCNPERPTGVPLSRLTDTFGNFQPNVEMAQAYEAAKRVADGETWSLVMVGEPGTGKTHLAIAALLAFGRGQFWKVADLLDEIRQRAYGEGEGAAAVLAEYRHLTGVLVLDDMGTQKVTDWVGETLYRILDSRYEMRLPTVITSNRPFSDLDPRLQSRYRSGLVVCQGRDWRD